MPSRQPQFFVKHPLAHAQDFNIQVTRARDSCLGPFSSRNCIVVTGVAVHSNIVASNNSNTDGLSIDVAFLPLTTAMLRSYVLPARQRGSDDNGTSKPKWLSRRVTPVLLSLSRRASLHPIYVLVFVAILASTTYLGLLDSSLFDRQTSASHAPGLVDFDALLQGSKNLFAGPESGWKWIPEPNGMERKADDVC